MDFFEWFKGIGALIGTFTGIAFFWDKFVREWPVAYILANPLMPGSMNKSAYFRIENRSAWPILIWWEGGLGKDKFRLSSGHETRQIVTALVKGEVTYVVAGGETVDLVLFRPVNFSEIQSSKKLAAQVRWRYLQSTFWVLPRTLSAKITKQDYQKLVEEEMEDAD